MKLNLGCGTRKFPGWLNVDSNAACEPDQVVDLEKIPWPWPSDYADEVLLSHVLEHLGSTPSRYLEIIQELYRVCCNGAKITIMVPHPRHDFFLNDPTHVRPITVDSLALFSQKENRNTTGGGFGNTPLGIYTGVDLEIVHFTQILDETWRPRFARGEVSESEINQAARQYMNVFVETRVELKAIKPAGSSSQP
jgi:hypothetical protein